ncbi:MAG TPA: hypothetical protein PLR20_14770 [Syntrophales bacterium]|nr:hypothetical protein [Syntrophales bacterium]
MDNRQFIFDNLLNLKESAAVTASAAATALAEYIDLGAGFVKGMLVVDVSAITLVAASLTVFQIVLQASNTTTFTEYVQLARLSLGTKITSALPYTGTNTVGSTGRYLLPFTNWYDSRLQRYVRLYTYVIGTQVSKTITYSAFLSKME